MARTSQLFRDHATGQGGANFIVGLLTITHPDPSILATPLRLSSLTDRTILSRGETFYPSGFDFRIPSLESEGEQRTKIVLAVADRQVLETLKSTHVRFDLLLEIVLSGTPDIVEQPFRMVDAGKTYDSDTQTLAVDCTYRDVMSNPRPRKRYSPAFFPALFGRVADAA